MAITNIQSKTANIILVYKNTSILDYKDISSVNSWISNPLTRLANAIEDFVLSVGRLRLTELFLDRKVVLSICGGAK
jgi:hypothetical protein